MILIKQQLGMVNNHVLELEVEKTQKCRKDDF